MITVDPLLMILLMIYQRYPFYIYPLIRSKLKRRLSRIQKRWSGRIFSKKSVVYSTFSIIMRNLFWMCIAYRNNSLIYLSLFFHCQYVIDSSQIYNTFKFTLVVTALFSMLLNLLDLLGCIKLIWSHKTQQWCNSLNNFKLSTVYFTKWSWQTLL